MMHKKLTIIAFVLLGCGYFKHIAPSPLPQVQNIDESSVLDTFTHTDDGIISNEDIGCSQAYISGIEQSLDHTISSDYTIFENNNIYEDVTNNNDISHLENIIHRKHNNQDQSGKDLTPTMQQYVLLDQRFNHEQKFKRKENRNTATKTWPLTDVVLNFLWQKMKPVAHAVSSTFSKKIDFVVKKCQSNCQCSWTAVTTQNWLSGRNNKYDPPSHCKSRNRNGRDESSISTSTYDRFLNTFMSKAKKLHNYHVMMPLVPVIDISKYDKSMANVEFEDQILFHLIQNAIGLAFGKLFESIEKHLSASEAANQLALEKYVTVVKKGTSMREDRLRYRREDLKQLS